VYGPQKGATPEMVEQLDKNLAHFAHIVKRSTGHDVADRPGAGAGGGIAAGLMAFANATLKRGVELVVEATKLEEHMRGADLAITGEGRVDFQTAFGKTPSGVAAAARKYGVPVVAIGGGLADRWPGVGDAQRDAARRRNQEVAPVSAGCRREGRAADCDRTAHEGIANSGAAGGQVRGRD
jgi:glycerate kinase